MRSFDSLLSDYSRVDLLEYEFVVDSHVWLSLLGYPKDEADPKAGHYKLWLSKPQAVAFQKIDSPTRALVVAESRTADALTSVVLEFANGASIRVACIEVLWVESRHG